MKSLFSSLVVFVQVFIDSFRSARVAARAKALSSPPSVSPPQDVPRRRGRPRLDICKDVITKVRWSVVESDALTLAAGRRGLDVSKYIRQAVSASVSLDLLNKEGV